MKNNEITSLIKEEAVQLKKLESIVKQTIDDEKLIIDNLLNPPAEIITIGQ
jgi:hypothetical protein